MEDRNLGWFVAESVVDKVGFDGAGAARSGVPFDSFSLGIAAVPSMLGKVGEKPADHVVPKLDVFRAG